MSGIGTGLDAQVTAAKESSYGVYVAGTRAFEFASETFQRNKVTVQGTGIRAGGRFARSARRVITTRDGKGQLTGDFVTSGMGIFLRQVCGAGSTNVQRGATGVYDQTHTPGQLLGESLSIQKGVPNTATGAVEPFTYVGCKITDLELTMNKAGLLVAQMTFDAQDEQTLGSTPAGPALATPSFTASAVPFSFLNASLTLGGSPVAGVTKASVALHRKLRTDRYYFNSSGLKAEPLENDWQAVDGSLTADFVTRAALYDSFASDASLQLVLTFVGPQIGATGVSNQLTVTVPVVKLNGETPKVSGPDIVSLNVPFEGLDNGTNPVITYVLTTGDTTY